MKLLQKFQQFQERRRRIEALTFVTKFKITFGYSIVPMASRIEHYILTGLTELQEVAQKADHTNSTITDPELIQSTLTDSTAEEAALHQNSPSHE